MSMSILSVWPPIVTGHRNSELWSSGVATTEPVPEPDEAGSFSFDCGGVATVSMLDLVRTGAVQPYF